MPLIMVIFHRHFETVKQKKSLKIENIIEYFSTVILTAAYVATSPHFTELFLW